MTALPTVTYTLELNDGLVPDLVLEAVQGSDVQIEVVLTRDGTPIDHDDLELKVNLSSPDRTTWIRSVTGDAGATAAASLFVELTPAELDNSGRMLIDLVVLDGSLNVIQARGICILYPEVPDSGTLPAGNVINWSKPTGYANTATHGPVRPGTGITNTVNADGSNTHAVAYGTTAGTAAQGNDPRLSDARTPTAHASTHAAGGSDPVTAADVSPSGTQISGALDQRQPLNSALTGYANAADAAARRALIDAVGNSTFLAGLATTVKLTGAELQTIDSGGTFTALEIEGPGAYIVLDKDGTQPNEAAVFQFRRGADTDVWQSGLRPDNDINVDPNDNRATSVNAWIVRNGTIGNGRHPLWIDKVTNFVYAPVGFVARFIRALTSAGLALQDSTGAEHALLTATGLRIRPRIVSANITAELDGVYHGTAAATYTDPTPAEGRGYLVRVVNGTQTVGGTAYAAEGTVIMREFHSGSWRNRVLFGGADAAGVRANIGAGFVDYILGHYPKPAASALDWLLLNRAIRIPSASPGVAFCRTAAAAETTFAIRKNGSNIGTVVFAAAGTVGTVTVTSNTDFAAGDRLELLAPATPDADLSDMQLSLKGIIL